MTTDKSKKKAVEEFVYTYTSNMNQLEEENKILKETVDNLREELDRYKSTPLLVCEVKDVVGEQVIIRLSNGNEFMVEKSGDLGSISAGDSVLCEQKNLTVVKKVDATKNFNVEKFVIMEKPKIKWHEVGGLTEQIQDVKEVIELPLKKPELFKKVGINPPKGVLLHGPPGTGKTLIAKAVATSTQSTFIEIVGSELVQKFIGEGAKLVKEIFALAKQKAPCVIFIDEMDALAAKRIDMGTSGEREVQRTFMQLLAEIDGFKPLGNVKIIGCTNRADILDPAITRPGRLDRMIKVDLPNQDGIRQILNIHSKQMKMNKNVDLEKIIPKLEGMSGAEIKAVCMEAGYFAIRKNRTSINESDLLKGIDKVKQVEEDNSIDYKGMFG